MPAYLHWIFAMLLAPQQRIYATFFLFAMSSGALLARMPDLQDYLGVNKAELGLTLIGMAIGSLISLTLSSPIIMRIGAKMTSIITLFGSALLLAVVPWMPNAISVFVIFFLIGLLGGALEINLNVEIGRIEKQIGFGVMSRAHGFWSVGFFFTAISASFIRQADISVRTHMFVALIAVLIVGTLALATMKNAPPIEGKHDDKAPLISLPTLGLAPLCIIGVSAFLVEGAGIDWSAIYMRDVFASEPFIGGMGLTLFAFFMSLARLTVDPVIDRYGRRQVAVVLLAIAAIGIAAVWLAPHPYIALAGFALMGGGCSAVYPMAVTAAAERQDRPSVVNVAALGQMAFVVFFLAPPLLGFVAEHFGIRNSYLVCLPLIILSIFAAKSLGSSTK